MHGREQVNALARLAQPCKPDQLAGFRIADRVKLRSVGTPLTVIDLQPPSLLVLQSDQGQQLRAGWMALERVTE